MRKEILCNQRGSVINIALLILMLLTLLGITFANLSSTDIKISGNEEGVAAEAARGYVSAKPTLYGSANVTPTQPMSFPVVADVTVVATALGAKQSFSGTVEYLDHRDPPRGSGYAADKFQAHRYQMNCEGAGPSDASSDVEAGFYRIGF